MSFTAIILAAGKGTRMKSDLPKVLHPICGRPVIDYPLAAAREAGAGKVVVVVGHGGDAVREAVSEKNIDFVYQAEQLGTGHAAMMCEEFLSGSRDDVIILCGDAPLIQASTLSELSEQHNREGNAVTVLTADISDPTGYGRIVKDGDEIIKIVEEKDASDGEKGICEINSGIYCVKGDFLFHALKQVSNDNRQKEYYLTDIIQIGKEEGNRVGWVKISDSDEIMGINSRRELAEAGRIMQQRILEKLMNDGVSVIDPACTYIDRDVRVGKDTRIYPGVRLEGRTLIGEHVTLESGVVVKESIIGDRSHIKPYSVIDDSEVGEDTAIGPFAHLRPESVLMDRAKVGNFVETKKAVIGEGSKANHLSYIGDAEVGRDVNIGAGTITCNYDGKNKFQTTIEEGSFVGSGTSLVAPVKVGSGSVIGAGSTITKDVPSDALSLSRPEQRTVEGWAKKRREKWGEK